MSDTEVFQPEGVPASPKEITTQSVVEAILFASDVPLPAGKIAQIVGAGDAREVKKHIAALNEKYEAGGAAFRIEEIAAGFQMLTLPEYNTWLGKLLKTRSDSKLSQAALETLAVVAYKQPVLRADIEAIRGVAAGEMLNRLRELGLIKIVGRAEEIGRPMLYGTTKKFLEVFGLADLDELPQVEELRPPEPKPAAPAAVATPVETATPAAPAEPAAETAGEEAPSSDKPSA
jgi:segregation and condensation protein B